MDTNLKGLTSQEVSRRVAEGKINITSNLKTKSIAEYSEITFVLCLTQSMLCCLRRLRLSALTRICFLSAL